VVAGNDPQVVRQAAEATRSAVLDRTDLVLGNYPLQMGQIPAAHHPGREHFGFADGISQPGIRGYTDSSRSQWLTARRLPPGDPEYELYGLPGQHLVWPGEFVLGYPGGSPDPRLPGPVRPVPSWMHNGSFLVYRRLQQHVDAFRATMRSEAERLARLPGFRGMTPERLAAMLVGRWPSGAPLLRTPKADCPALGRNRLLNNDFRYDDDSPPRGFRDSALANAPRAEADSLGMVCPLGSHIRKVNLRDQASDVGGASATQSRRILRVGVPYDDSRPAENGRPTIDDRGLLFLSIQASIEDQFEFLQARWINSRSRPRGPGGNDMLVGQNVANADGERRCTIFGDGMAQAEVVARENFVTMTGGAYFFVPALSTLRRLLDGALQP
jgi:Dyp-type peroxidase family